MRHPFERSLKTYPVPPHPLVRELLLDWHSEKVQNTVPTESGPTHLGAGMSENTGDPLEDMDNQGLVQTGPMDLRTRYLENPSLSFRRRIPSSLNVVTYMKSTINYH